MSSASFHVRSAVAFNRRHADYEIPPGALEEFPELVAPRDHENFAYATRDLQQELFHDSPEEWDGRYGRGTATEASKRYEWVDDDARYIIRNGLRLPVTGERESKLLTWEDDGGLDLHRVGGWARRKNAPTCVVWHWGGLYAAHCRRVLAGRGLSSHFGVDRGTSYQWLDVAHKAYHAGWINQISVGIDICQQPETKHEEYYRDRGYDLDVIDNPSSPRRGARRVLALHPETVRASAELAADLSQAMGFTLDYPDSDAVMSKASLKAWRGFVAHHHVSKPKWDIAPWGREVMELARTLG